ncbi:TPA: hypothetical protein ACNDPT_002473 [Escherichia coli]
MAKKSGNHKTKQSIGGGMTAAEAHHRYGRYGDGSSCEEEANTYLSNMRNSKYIGNDKVAMPLSRNQRRLAKKMGINLENES